jgi:hypothetical protein
MLATNVMLFQSQHVLRHLPGISFVDKPEHYREMLLDVLPRGMAGEGARVAARAK